MAEALMIAVAVAAAWAAAFCARSRAIEMNNQTRPKKESSYVRHQKQLIKDARSQRDRSPSSPQKSSFGLAPVKLPPTANTEMEKRSFQPSKALPAGIVPYG